MSGKTAGARLKKTPEEGEALLNNFFAGFPNVKLAIDYSKEFLHEKGYVVGLLGRRRHLPEINAPAYEVKYLNKDEELAETFNPFLGCANREPNTPIINKWKKTVSDKVKASQMTRQKKALEAGKPFVPNDEMSNMAYKKLAADATKDGVLIVANTGRRAQAERQCFNARIQGSAATLTKLAMIDIAKDKTLNDCVAKLIIPVHDELLVECPEYYADTVEKRLPEVMVGAAAKAGDNIPQSCDPYNVTRWYADEMAALLTDTFKNYLNGDKEKGILPIPREEAIDKLCGEHAEIPRQSILDVLEGRTPDEVIF